VDYGWTLPLVSQSGGMAAAALTTASWQGAAVRFGLFAVAVPVYFLFLRARTANGKTA
jgi:hypothetical protein